MDQVAAGDDLQKSFSAYTAAVKDLEKAGQRARDRGQSMKARMNEYVARWQNEIDSTQDPAIQSALTSRREAVRQNFQKVVAAAQEVRAAYDPFLSQNQEIQRALAIDLTPQQVSALKPAMEKARGQGTTLKAKLTVMQDELNRMAGEMSPAPSM